jgi:TRAP-type C4-dicarboxylate transport system permease small subunit
MTESRKSFRDLHAVDVPALILFAALLIVVFLQFFTRYVLNDSLGWTEEVARYLLIIVAYAGSVTAVRRSEHIFLEFAYRLAPKANAKPLAVFVAILGVTYHFVLTALAIRLALGTEQRMVAIDAPKALVYGLVGLALLAASYFALQMARRRWRQSSDEILDDIQEAAIREAKL